jgi:hypothetical protein
MNLSHLFELTDVADLDGEILRALNANANWLPTQKACERGWPREVVVDRVRELRIDADGIAATVDVSFTECFGTGCSETFAETPRWMECRFRISRPTGCGTIEAIDREPAEEF